MRRRLSSMCRRSADRPLVGLFVAGGVPFDDAGGEMSGTFSRANGDSMSLEFDGWLPAEKGGRKSALRGG